MGNIIDMLDRAGYDSYIIGSSLRELIMNKSISELSVVTSASMRELKFLFPKASDCGDYIFIIKNKIGLRLRPYRSVDGKNADIYTDLALQDFTINALAYKYDFLDIYGGRKDIEDKVIRCVGDAEIFFKENPTKILSAVELACMLGFSIEEKTAAAMKKYARLLLKVNQNKIREELNKILLSNDPGKIILLHELGILKHIMYELEVCFHTPQKNKYHIYNVGEHIVHTLENTPNSLTLRWAALLHDIGKPDCKSVDSSGVIHFYGHHRKSADIANNILYRLRFDSEFIDNVSILVENHDVRIDPSMASVKRIMARTGERLFEKLLLLQEADACAKNPIYLQEKTEKIDETRAIYRRILAENQPYLVSQLLIGRKELRKIGVKQGHDLSDILKVLLDEVIINPNLNNSEYLIKEAKRLKNSKRKPY